MSAPATSPTLVPGDHVAAWLPASWWIADPHGDDDPAVWAPRPGKPRFIVSRIIAGPALWPILAAALPDRGTCDACAAVACAEHGGGQ